MDKLVFKVFCLWILIIVFATLLAGCKAMNGYSGKQILNETNKEPKVYFCLKSNCGEAYVSNIKSANYSVHCAFYDIKLGDIIHALANKSKTSDVRLVMDSSNSKGQVKGEGIRVDNDKQLMHNKFCVIDDYLIITGSYNPTENDNYKNDNNILVIYSKILAKNYEDEFEELWSGRFGQGANAENSVIYINGMKVENYFCPEDCQLEFSSAISKNSGLSKIIDLIRNANESVKVAAFTFSHEAIADELNKADSRGINVSIVIESKQRNVMGSQYERAKGFGLNIKLDKNKYNMHHKFIIIDGKIVVTGSPNFTLSGFNKNDENMLIIYDEKIAYAFLEEFNSLWN